MKFWNWFTNLFTGKDKIISLIDSAKAFVEKALPVVQAIEEQIKPFVNDNNKAFLNLKLVTFLSKYNFDFDYVTKIAEQLVKLPNADLLFNLALEVLKVAAPTNTPLSVLRLAVELAYNLYKASKTA